MLFHLTIRHTIKHLCFRLQKNSQLQSAVMVQYSVTEPTSVSSRPGSVIKTMTVATLRMRATAHVRSGLVAFHTENMAVFSVWHFPLCRAAPAQENNLILILGMRAWGQSHFQRHFRQNTGQQLCGSDINSFGRWCACLSPARFSVVEEGVQTLKHFFPGYQVMSSAGVNHNYFDDCGWCYYSGRCISGDEGFSECSCRPTEFGSSCQSKYLFLIPFSSGRFDKI